MDYLIGSTSAALGEFHHHAGRADEADAQPAAGGGRRARPVRVPVGRGGVAAAAPAGHSNINYSNIQM